MHGVLVLLAGLHACAPVAGAEPFTTRINTRVDSLTQCLQWVQNETHFICYGDLGLRSSTDAYRECRTGFRKSLTCFCTGFGMPARQRARRGRLVAELEAMCGAVPTTEEMQTDEQGERMPPAELARPPTEAEVERARTLLELLRIRSELGLLTTNAAFREFAADVRYYLGGEFIRDALQLLRNGSEAAYRRAVRRLVEGSRRFREWAESEEGQRFDRVFGIVAREVSRDILTVTSGLVFQPLALANSVRLLSTLSTRSPGAIAAIVPVLGAVGDVFATTVGVIDLFGDERDRGTDDLQSALDVAGLLGPDRLVTLASLSLGAAAPADPRARPGAAGDAPRLADSPARFWRAFEAAPGSGG